MKNSHRLITAVSFYTAIAGILSTILPILTGGFEFYRSTWYWVLSYFIPHLALDYFDTTEYTFWFEQSGINISICTLVFYLFFLAGAIIFAVRGFRDSRIIGFCFSVLLIKLAISTLVSIFFLATGREVGYSVKALLLFLLALIAMAAWFALYLYMLRLLKKNNDLLITVYTTEDGSREGFAPASKWQRLLHYFVDYIVLLLITTPVIYTIGFRFRHTGYFREEWWIGVFLLPLFVFYYLFFEGLPGKSPGKYLTATRVTNDYGDKPKFGKVVGRTFSRLVPFEPLSFLGVSGWHDQWTDTYVLKEKRNGFKDNIYWLILPLIILLAIGTYYTLDWFSVR
jgi:uncharacterized RDD family membrane protein YckC